jgi:predicted nucleic acid-binding Zn ribbon protein
VRRLAPRPLRSAIEAVTRQAAPAGALARTQACWEEVAGPRVAAEAEPVSERAGVLTIRCSSAVWAQELELLSEDLLERLREALGDPSALQSLRLVVGSAGGARRPPRRVL